MTPRAGRRDDVESRRGAAVPLLSVVTATYNRAKLLPAAVESVLAQGFPDFEHIVVDGASSDDTLEVLAPYPHLKVTSEPDRGLYDAWNKGIARCSGAYIGILNSDDLYAPAFFAAAARAIRDRSPGVVSGRAREFVPTASGGIGRFIRTYADSCRDRLGPSGFPFSAPCLNARLIRRDLLDRVGGFSLEYPLASDCDFAVRLAAARPSAVWLDHDAYYYRIHDGSISFNADSVNFLGSTNEKLAVLEAHLGRDSPDRELATWLKEAHGAVSAIAFLRSLRQASPGRALRYAGSVRWSGHRFALETLREVTRIGRYKLTRSAQ